MPDSEIPVGAQIFDVVFHPTFSTVYTGLLTGHVKAFSYDEQGNHQPAFSVRPSKLSCRGLSLNEDGSQLYAVGKGKALNTIDTLTEAIDTRLGAHDSTINRVKHLLPGLLSTGDDDGTVKLWDPRKRDSVRTYTQHFDYITDFLWLDDKRQLVATSGDGSLSVMDVRSKNVEPFAQSEDQEDELLSIVAIKGASKVVVGTQLGILSIFNRSSGWGDCVDRIPGHPLSVDALCGLPPDLPNVDSSSTILTGSSDGFVRAVRILPTKLLGVVADHGEWPIERISIGGGLGQLSTVSQETHAAQGNVSKPKSPQGDGENDDENSTPSKRWWVGSVGHENVLRMTDLEGFFLNNESGNKEGKGALVTHASGKKSDSEDSYDSDMDSVDAESPKPDAWSKVAPKGKDSETENASGSSKKRKQKPENERVLSTKRSKNIQNDVIVKSFFDNL